MWIILRLLVFVVVLAARLRKNVFPPKLFGVINDNAVYHRRAFGSRSLVGYRVGIPFEVPVLFRLQKESGWDGFFKAIGFAKEFQTGDEHFDRSIYIASDHPALFEHLAERDEARRLVMDAMESGYHRITADGSFLWLEFHGAASPSETDMARVDKLHSAFKDLGRRIRLRKDHYNLRVVIVEAITWSIAVFGLATFFRASNNGFVGNVDQMAVNIAGLGAAAAAFLLLVLGIRIFLGQSSRGHRILVEGVFLLLIGLPLSGIRAVSELNRTRDDSIPIIVELRVSQKFTTTISSRRGGSRRVHHIEFTETPVVWSSTMKKSIRVSAWSYAELSEGSRVRFEVYRGYLGFAWYDGYSR